MDREFLKKVLRLPLIVIVFGIIPSLAEASAEEERRLRCQAALTHWSLTAQFHREADDFIETSNGTIMIRGSRLTFFRDNGSTLESTLPYDASHLAILRRQIGESRFQNALAAANPSHAIENEAKNAAQEFENLAAVRRVRMTKSESLAFAEKLIDRSFDRNDIRDARRIAWGPFITHVKMLREKGELFLDLDEFLGSISRTLKPTDSMAATAYIWVARAMVVQFPGGKSKKVVLRLFSQGGMHEYLMDRLSEDLGLDGRDFWERRAVIVAKRPGDNFIHYQEYDRTTFRFKFGEAGRVWIKLDSSDRFNLTLPNSK